MGGYTEDGYEARTEDEIVESYRDSIETVYGDDLEGYQGSIVEGFIVGFAATIAQNQEQDLESLYDSLFIETAEGEELTHLAEGYGVNRIPAIAATGVVEWTRDSTGTERTIPSGTRVTTEQPEAIEYVTTEAAEFASGDTTAKSNIKAVEGGTHGNVAAHRVTEMPSPPPGITSVTNNNPVGDPSYTLTDGSQQTLGQERESDQELRERVLEGASIGGAATVRAVRDKIRALDGSPSLTIYTNRKLSDNANGNGLPALSSELVIHAPSVPNSDIAQAIHEIISVTERQTSGNNGTSVTQTITDDVLFQDRTIEWSEPTEQNLTITVDVVTEAGYAGDERVKAVISEYIGGTLPDGSAAPGLDVGDDVIVDEMERLINNLDGTVGVASVKIDSNGDGTDDTTTRSDGLTAFEVAKDEVAMVDGTSNITVN